MKIFEPVMDMCGNLTWTDSGTVVATWRLEGLSYKGKPLEDKRMVAAIHKALLRVLPRESLLSGVAVDVDAYEVVERMIAGVDLDQCPLWVKEADATLSWLTSDECGLRMGRRVYYLSVVLPNEGGNRLGAPFTAAVGRFADFAGVPRARRTDKEVAARLQQAEEIESTLPRPFKPQPITVAEQVWFAIHRQERGLVSFHPDVVTETTELVTASGAAIPEPVLDQGAVSDLDKRRFNPMKRRVVKVTNEHTLDPEVASYQALMIMSSTPHNGITFPGGELFSRLDELELERPVDWALRMRSNTREEVMRSNKKAMHELHDQYDQRENSEGFGSDDLDRADYLLREYQNIFSNDTLEVEIEHSLILAASADSFEGADQAAGVVGRYMASAGFTFARPINGDHELWWAMDPAVSAARTRLVRAYRQYTTSTGLARTVPLVTSHLGGRRGPAIARHRSTFHADLIHLDITGYPEIDESGSVAIVGKLGSGKSYTLKTLAGHAVSMGGQLLALDSSKEEEWATFAAALVDDAVLVDARKPKWSMDPLRCMPTLEQGAQDAQTFCLSLLNVGPRDPEGRILTKVLSPAYLREHDLSSLEAVLQHLQSEDCAVPGAPDVGDQLQQAADSAYGPVTFDESLPPVDPASDAIVWLTHELEQPTVEELEKDHLFRQLSPEKIYSRSYHRLIMRFARRAATADNSRFTAVVADEAYKFFANPENVNDAIIIVREGRRGKSGLLLGSHSPHADFPPTIRKLIPTRIVHKHVDADLAAESIEFLGKANDDPEFAGMVKQLREDTSPDRGDGEGVIPGREGECFILDAFGRLADAQILGPAQPHLRAAVTSTPPTSRARLTLEKEPVG